MTTITLNYSGKSTGDEGRRIDPFDLEEELEKLRLSDIGKIIVKGNPPDEVLQALAVLADCGHTIERVEE